MQRSRLAEFADESAKMPTPQVKQAAEKLGFGVILSGAKNLSSI
jgi:hypothetical protein